MKILIIDDEKPTLNMFRLFLSAYGYEVLTADSGEKGLEVFVRERPQIVLTDIKMPGMDGIEVLKLIKEVDASTQVIMVTGHGDMELAIKALNLDAADFVNKPIQRQALDQALKRARERMTQTRGGVNEITLRTSENGAVISLAGVISGKSMPYLSEAYEQAKTANADMILFRFEENATINGAGLDCLGEVIRQGREDGQKMAVVGLSENFKSVFSVVGLDKQVDIYDNEEEIPG